MVRSWDVAYDRPAFDARPLIRNERAQLVTFLRSLDAAEWSRPTTNVAWSVHDVALHLLGNDIGRLAAGATIGAEKGPRGELPFEELAMAIEKSNDRWVVAARRISPSLVVDLLEFVGPKVDAVFAAVDMETPGVAVAWTGDGPSPCWLDIAREYAERWVHHAQIRLAVAAVPLLDRRWFFPVLDVFMRCLPRAYEDIGAPTGSIVRVQVTGESGGAWFVQRLPDRWHLVADPGTGPAAEVRVDPDIAWRLLSRTMTVEAALPEIAIAGDEALARAITRAVAIMTSRL